MGTYGITLGNIQQLKKVIKKDFTQFVQTHNSSASLAMWCLGDLTDPQQLAHYLQSGPPEAVYLNLMQVYSELVDIIKHAPGVPKPIALAVEVDKFWEVKFGTFNQINFDYWISYIPHYYYYYYS